MDEAHTISAMRYVEMNPVRAGLCGHPEEWPWSSSRGNLGIANDPLIDRTATECVISDWANYLALQEGADDLRRLRQQTDTGRPDGSDKFIDLIESRTGRRVRKRRAGRKRQSNMQSP
jgi:putative transposase